MPQEQVTILNEHGLHTRAASKLVDLACRYQSSIHLSTQNNSANAKSILELMLLGAVKGTELEITAEGIDEAQALEALIALINDRFGEPS